MNQDETIETLTGLVKMYKSAAECEAVASKELRKEIVQLERQVIELSEDNARLKLELAGVLLRSHYK